MKEKLVGLIVSSGCTMGAFFGSHELMMSSVSYPRGSGQEKQLKFAYDYNKIIVKSYNDLSEKVESFNSLPWYKKMFYKIKL